MNRYIRILRNILLLSLIIPFYANATSYYWLLNRPAISGPDKATICTQSYPPYESGSRPGTISNTTGYVLDQYTNPHLNTAQDACCYTKTSEWKYPYDMTIYHGIPTEYCVDSFTGQSCASNQGWDSTTKQCVDCPAGQSVNPYTNQCQQDCVASPPTQIAVKGSGTYMTPNPAIACVDGCQSEYSMPNAGSVCRIVGCGPGQTNCVINEYDCLVVYARDTGQFCSGSSNTWTYHNADSCPAGWYLSGGVCMQEPVCESGVTYLSNHQCVPEPDCGENAHNENHQCVPDPNCDVTEVKQGHVCVPVTCEPGQVVANHQCNEPECDGENVHREGHFCMPDPVCDDDEKKEGHVCVPVVCGIDQEPRFHQCGPVQCAEGYKYSFVLHQCLKDDLSCPAGSHKEGLSCVADEPPDLQCPQGTIKNGDRCESAPQLACPPGTVKQGESCVSVVRPLCASGSHLEGASCVSDSPPTVHCPAGTHQVGSGCDSDSPPSPPSCPSGQSLVGSECVSDTGPDNGTNPPSCPAGTHLSGSSCVSDAPPSPPSCPSGQSLVGGVCVVNSENVTKTCEPGESLTDGKCVKDAPPSCPSGQSLVGGVCVASEVSTCLPGQTLSRGVCVSSPSVQCEQGFTRVGNTCVLDSAGVVPGSDEGTGSGEGQCDPATQECGQASGAAPLVSLYQKQERTFSDVWGKFISRVQSAPIVNAGVSFFTMSAVGGTCPVWVIPATYISGAVTIDLQCSQAVVDAFGVASIILLMVAAWVAFRIAFL